MRTGMRLITALMASLPSAVMALDLELPASANQTGTWTKPDAGFLLPVSPFTDGKLDMAQLSGTPNAQSFRFPLNGLTTADIMSNLRAQVQESGYTTLLDCSARACGGFDFRYELNLLPEPKMHVDLGDYRFISAVRTEEDGEQTHLQLVVSRSPSNGFVQLTTISQADAAAEIIAATKTPDVVTDQAENFISLSDRLLNSGRAVLDGLAFQTGSSQLADGGNEVLGELAAFLQANPDITVALVGHTDAEGSLAGNLALSKKRAESVASHLRNEFAIPSSVMEAQGVGYLAPIAPNTTDEGRQKNRRVEVVITSTR